MRNRNALLIILALFFAGGTAFIAHAWLSAQSAVVAVAPPPPLAAARAVLVAREALPMGHLLKPEDLVWQRWPEGDINPSYVLQGTRTQADFASAVLRQPLGKGEPITGDRVVAPGDRGFLAAVLRPGMRAVSVGVDATSGISGFVFPGDQVDILLTHILQSDGPVQRKATETILRDVRIIAIDQKVSSKQDEPTVVHDVTVEVTPKQSELIAVATSMGKLSLSLRSIALDPNEPVEDTEPAGSRSATASIKPIRWIPMLAACSPAALAADLISPSFMARRARTSSLEHTDDGRQNRFVPPLGAGRHGGRPDLRRESDARVRQYITAQPPTCPRMSP